MKKTYRIKKTFTLRGLMRGANSFVDLTEMEFETYKTYLYPFPVDIHGTEDEEETLEAEEEMPEMVDMQDDLAPNEREDEEEEEDDLTCSDCGFVSKSTGGLKRHRTAKHG